MNSKLKINSLESDEGTKEAFIQAIRFRKILMETLARDIEVQQATMGDEEDFSSPSWALIQAHKMGQIKALRKILSYLS